MNKHLLKPITSLVLLFGCLLSSSVIKAQYVTIPDAAFVSWLNANGYSQCLNGSQLDTSCSAVLNAKAMHCYAKPIHDLTGLQYFKGLDTLDCSNDSLGLIPALPHQLKYLNCQYNNLTSLPLLDDSLQFLDCFENRVTSLPLLPAALQFIDCGNNVVLTSLPVLPSSLLTLYCSDNMLSILPALPVSLQELDCSLNSISALPSLPDSLSGFNCSYNNLSTLPALPSNLLSLTCSVNQITSLPDLPPALQWFDCGFNLVTALPSLPSSLQNVYCWDNQITAMLALPVSLQGLYCAYNNLTSLPALPGGLIFLNCADNQITALPSLPSQLISLECENNQLTELPAIPSSLTDYLNFSFNQITYVPPIPSTLNFFYCDHNLNLTCLPELGTIGSMNFDSTSITCVPDYGTIQSCYPPIYTVPLCDPNNSNHCPAYWNIEGQVFSDTNQNCLHDAGEAIFRNVKVDLISNGVILQQQFTNEGGYYSFYVDSLGSYQVSIDTSNLPLQVSCPANNIRTEVIYSLSSGQSEQDFALVCPQGFDIGVWSISAWWFQPGNTAIAHIHAGDVSNFYGAHCAAGTSGSVTAIINGPVTYVSAAPGALTPASVSGDTIVWTIPDFGTLSPDSAFNIVLNTLTTAHAGDQVCFTVLVAPLLDDNNPSNNTLSQCFTVLDALDPNFKEASPTGNIDTTQQWLTYTIHFQNTGTAPAGNIVVNDTLDATHLDLSSIQLLAYSSPATVRVLKNGVVQFNFANVNLPDSGMDFAASQGYLQFKIKLIEGLPIGTRVSNTGYIYFDYNPAVVTNTAVTVLSASTGLVQTGVNNSGIDLYLYPNPAKDYVMIGTSQAAIGGTLQITDITGKEVLAREIQNVQFKLPATGLMSGVYFVKVIDTKQQTVVRKLILQ